MRWAKKEKVQLHTGDTKSKIVFLWFPKLIGKEWVWLEKAIKEQTYFSGYFRNYWIVEYFNYGPQKGV